QVTRGQGPLLSADSLRLDAHALDPAQNRIQIEYVGSAWAPSTRAHKTLICRTFVGIGETGFEPATARPPARGMGCCSVDEGRISRVSCVWVRPSCSQLVPQIVPRTSVRGSLSEFVVVWDRLATSWPARPHSREAVAQSRPRNTGLGAL